MMKLVLFICCCLCAERLRSETVTTRHLWLSKLWGRNKNSVDEHPLREGYSDDENLRNRSYEKPGSSWSPMTWWRRFFSGHQGDNPSLHYHSEADPNGVVSSPANIPEDDEDEVNSGDLPLEDISPDNYENSVMSSGPNDYEAGDLDNHEEILPVESNLPAVVPELHNPLEARESSAPIHERGTHDSRADPRQTVNVKIITGKDPEKEAKVIMSHHESGAGSNKVNSDLPEEELEARDVHETNPEENAEEPLEESLEKSPHQSLEKLPEKNSEEDLEEPSDEDSGKSRNESNDEDEYFDKELKKKTT